MDRPKFVLNPNAAPFVPRFKRASGIDFKQETMFCDSTTYEEIDVHVEFDSTWQPSSNSTEKLLISDEDSPGTDYQIPEAENHVHQYETLGFEKQDLEDGSQMEQEYLSSLFPNFSLESVNEVYLACGNVREAKLMLEQLEGDVDSSHGLPDVSHFSGASSSGHNEILPDLPSQSDFEAVQ